MYTYVYIYMHIYIIYIYMYMYYSDVMIIINGIPSLTCKTKRSSKVLPGLRNNPVLQAGDDI